MKNCLFILAVLSFLGSVVSCSRIRQEKSEVKEVEVKVWTVESGQRVQSSSYVGIVHPAKSVVISSRCPGTLMNLAVAHGEHVSKGQVIAVVESSSLENAYKMAKATLDQAEDGYKRVMQLYETGSVPDIKKIEVESQLQKARAATEAAYQAYENCKIKAPFSGVVGEVYCDEGVDLSLMDPVVKLMDVSGVEIRFPVPEKEISRMKVGDTVVLMIPALEDSVCTATVKHKGMSASALAHSYECVVLPTVFIKNLLPGMVCKVYRSDQSQGGIVIPASVVQMDTEGHYVWMVENGIVHKRYIRIGGFSGKGVVVLDGLQEAERIIVEGSRKVSTGMRVKVKES